MNFIDCHCHLADNYFYKNIDNLIVEWRELGLTRIGTMSTNMKSIQRNILLSQKYPDLIISGIGRHPWGAHKVKENEIEQMEKYLIENKEAIVGEVGLDHYFIKDKKNQKEQTPIFESFLKMAKKHKRSIMLHTTGAEKQVYEILSSFKLNVNICCHWYSGPVTILRKLNDLGCYFSINPAFIKSKNHRNILNIVSIEKLLTESDGPVKSQGKVNTPKMMPKLIANLADEKQFDKVEFTYKILNNYLTYLNF